MMLGPDRPRATLGRQLRAAGGLVLLLLLFAGAAYGLWWVTVGRPVLAGENDHDFGVVQLSDKPAVLDHTFQLTNRSSRIVEIRDIRTSCGCAVAEPSTRSLEPGASVDIAATLTLKREGIKKARIFLIYGDGNERDVLHVQGAARKRERLTLVPGPAALPSGALVQRVVFFVDYEGNDRPPSPRITTPPEVRAEFTHWVQMTRRGRAKGLPARWRGEVRLQRAGETLPPDTTVIVAVGADQQVEIPLTSP
ncbi:MAG: DUF1573 domain-containing protein [Planctomycetota bacterium]|jgi:hypothetical protein